MSNIFQAVKATVPVPAAAERYGLQVRRGGMACCLFHEDRHPSMKIYDDHYYCFGCQAHGDVTDLTARLLGLQPYEAASRLAQDFGLPSPLGQRYPADTEFLSPFAQLRCGNGNLHSVGGTRSVTDEGRRNSANAHSEIRRFENDQAKCQRVLSTYLRLLERWRDEYEPKDPDAEPDDRYTEYCQMYSTIDYLTELLIVGDLEQRTRAVDLLLKDSKIDELDRWLKRIAAEEAGHTEPAA